ncbi:MAG: endo-1,3-alpha-glucanase family glycosylhydrolase [Capsulimonadaceae bacterium]|nr:endo-1,3-alpha-glucanase family glycosylhydrolase [Capsulimonadaceae bacterium]
MHKRYFPLAACALILSASAAVNGASTLMTPSTQSAQTRPVRLVFAHYMVCLPTAGPAATIADYENEIREAQSRGIDGFALNCGGWTSGGSYYKSRCAAIYEAAKRLRTGFKLFISADYCCGNGEAETRDMIETFRNHPNQLTWDGKPVLSTFGGGRLPEIYDLVKKRLTGNDAVVFVPYFFPKTNREHPTSSDIDQVFNDFPDLDGFFYFGAAGTSAAIATSNTALAQKWLGAGKIFMADVTPFYRSTGRVYETNGFEGMAEEWEGVIKANPTWVEITTWNDFQEKTYVSPFGPPALQELPAWHNWSAYSHAAYLDASRYYIDWYKSGKRPAIKSDKLYYFYRVEPKSASGRQYMDIEKREKMTIAGVDKLEDKIFATCFLTKPAQLTITSGVLRQTFALAAGIHHVAMPFAPGAPHFTLARGTAILIDKTGEQVIADRNGATSYNYFAGSAEAR